MSRANEPAFPSQEPSSYICNQGGDSKEIVGAQYFGMTMREHFAGLAMQGIVSKYTLSRPEDFEIVAQAAVSQADFLIAELAMPVRK